MDPFGYDGSGGYPDGQNQGSNTGFNSQDPNGTNGNQKIHGFTMSGTETTQGDQFSSNDGTMPQSYDQLGMAPQGGGGDAGEITYSPASAPPMKKRYVEMNAFQETGGFAPPLPVGQSDAGAAMNESGFTAGGDGAQNGQQSDQFAPAQGTGGENYGFNTTDGQQSDGTYFNASFTNDYEGNYQAAQATQNVDARPSGDSFEAPAAFGNESQDMAADVDQPVNNGDDQMDQENEAAAAFEPAMEVAKQGVEIGDPQPESNDIEATGPLESAGDEEGATEAENETHGGKDKEAEPEANRPDDGASAEVATDGMEVEKTDGEPPLDEGAADELAVEDNALNETVVPTEKVAETEVVTETSTEAVEPPSVDAVTPGIIGGIEKMVESGGSVEAAGSVENSPPEASVPSDAITEKKDAPMDIVETTKEEEPSQANNSGNGGANETDKAVGSKDDEAKDETPTDTGNKIVPAEDATESTDPKAPPTPSLVGTLSSSVKDGITLHTISGSWTFDSVPGSVPQRFELIQKLSSEVVGELPKDGVFEGSFDIQENHGGQMRTRAVAENGVNLTFAKKDDTAGSLSVKGQGWNEFGTFELEGIISSAENESFSVKLRKKYIGPAPREERKRKSKLDAENLIVTTPRKRTKKVASSSMKKRGQQSAEKSASKSPKGTPGSERKKKVEKLHRDSGKRYGLGKPDLYCDCCFLEEDKEIGQTPFIKCIHCGLIAHSACYPPIGKVDEQGNFLCDACTFKFHPSVNRANRTKNPTNGIPFPGPLSQDADAKNDGRSYEKSGKHFDVYCQLCARRDVTGGMKPTDSHTWVHLACLMAAEGAFFEGTVATNVDEKLKHNQNKVKRVEQGTGKKPKCEGCNGESGMLLKCRYQGCQTHLHALCAEILDRARVVDHIKGRDVLSYKCTIHSYVGLDACAVCQLGTKQNEMLECDKCHQGYHMSCMDPPLAEIPEGDWFCESCLNPQPEEVESSDLTTGIEVKQEQPSEAAVAGVVAENVEEENSTVAVVVAGNAQGEVSAGADVAGAENVEVEGAVAGVVAGDLEADGAANNAVAMEVDAPNPEAVVCEINYGPLSGEDKPSGGPTTL